MAVATRVFGLVQQGPTLMLALDAHVHHDGPFTVDDLEPYRHNRVPASQQEARRTRQDHAQSTIPKETL